MTPADILFVLIFLLGAGIGSWGTFVFVIWRLTKSQNPISRRTAASTASPLGQQVFSKN